MMPADAMMAARRFSLALLILLPVVPAFPAPPAGSGTPLPPEAAGLDRAGRHRVARILDGDTLALADGREVRLVGLRAPKQPPGRADVRPRPFARAATEALAALTLDRHVTLYYGGRRRDRYGRVLAHLVRDDGLWVQGEMLRRGLARVYSLPDNRALTADMLLREDAARRTRTGLWRLTRYAVKDHLEAGRFLNSFQIVEGRVRRVAEVRGTTYLNFGADWREDFTVVIRGTARRRFSRAGMDLKMLENKKIRIRGWVTYYNGPMIRATHPEQLELLSRTQGARNPETP